MTNFKIVYKNLNQNTHSQTRIRKIDSILYYRLTTIDKIKNHFPTSCKSASRDPPNGTAATNLDRAKCQQTARDRECGFREEKVSRDYFWSRLLLSGVWHAGHTRHQAAGTRSRLLQSNLKRSPLVAANRHTSVIVISDGWTTRGLGEIQR